MQSYGNIFAVIDIKRPCLNVGVQLVLVACFQFETDTGESYVQTVVPFYVGCLFLYGCL